MAEQQRATKKPRKKDHWDWLLGMTLGNSLNFIWWAFCTVLFAWLIEIVGMSYFWGPTHSRDVLHAEISYLGVFNRNLLTGFNPIELANIFTRWIETAIAFLHLRDLSAAFESGGAHSIGVYVGYGIEVLINSLVIFAVRLAICVSAATGFVLVGIVALADGLVERDIRRATGGRETAFIYHRSKRLIMPLTMLSFGIYMTLPISIHPTWVFLPVMGAVGYMIFTAAKTFKKYL